MLLLSGLYQVGIPYWSRENAVDSIKNYNNYLGVRKSDYPHSFNLLPQSTCVNAHTNLSAVICVKCASDHLTLNPSGSK